LQDTAPAKVYSDFLHRFDANTYTVPPWAIGKQVIVKADHRHPLRLSQDKVIATHSDPINAKNASKLPAHKEAALKQNRRLVEIRIWSRPSSVSGRGQDLPRTSLINP